MTDPKSANPPPPQPGPGESEALTGGAHDAPAPAAASGLTPEEQMALFEKELQENDWGHQPC